MDDVEIDESGGEEDPKEVNQFDFESDRHFGKRLCMILISFKVYLLIMNGIRLTPFHKNIIQPIDLATRKNSSSQRVLGTGKDETAMLLNKYI